MRILAKKKNGELYEVSGGGHIECWHNRDMPCSACCAALVGVVSRQPDGSEQQMFVCAAMPQQFPIGVPEPSRIVVPSPLVK